MKNIGIVIDTFSAKQGQSKLPRPHVESLNLIEGFGIEYDKFAGKDENKTVMIVGKFSYDLARKYGVELKLGSLGENILLDFNPHDYNKGTRFQIGETIIQITENCTICNHLAVFDDDLPFIVKNCRGLYCKILQGGEIKKGSIVKVIEMIQEVIAS